MILSKFIKIGVTGEEYVIVDCPVEGKGFGRVIVRTDGANVYMKVKDVLSVDPFLIGTAPTEICFGGGDNTTPRQLGFMSAGSTANVFVCVEEVGSNPV